LSPYDTQHCPICCLLSTEFERNLQRLHVIKVCPSIPQSDIFNKGLATHTHRMTHLSGGAISGIAFGVGLFVFVAASLALWWRRVYRDHYSKDLNTWGGSWGVKAQQELQERLDREREEYWRAKEAERDVGDATWGSGDVEMQRRSAEGVVEHAEARVVRPNEVEDVSGKAEERK